MELLAGYFGDLRAGAPAPVARESVADDDEKTAAFLKYTPRSRAVLRKRAARLVEREWKAIERVAVELLEHVTLDETEVETIILISDGREERATLVQYRRNRPERDGLPPL